MDKEDWKAAGILLGAFCAIMFVLAGLVELSAYISDSAKIEQLRSDLAIMEVVTEDVEGQATKWNQRIAEKQRWNNVPIFCLLIPNGWDRIELLEL